MWIHEGVKQMDHGFDNVTVCGKLCYVFMCMERYLLALYPDRDWSFVARKMWNCVSFWYGKRDVEDDCWVWGRYMDIIPDNLFETRRKWAHYSHELREEYYGEMTDDDYRSIREYGDIALIGYENFCKTLDLFEDITEGNRDEELVQMFYIPVDMWEKCETSDYNLEVGNEAAQEAIEKIENILKAHNIALPDSSPVLEFTPENTDPHTLSWIAEESKISNCDKWGFAVKADHLSQLITGPEY